ncbi:hypothetical protein ACFPYJ_30700 [Paenibacillus solisilvae]|uniref:Uncharacterized protein n=1 Tax=Paenibacillus solisilvae TaxID=2486751 RepID=A0ABW0W9N3_9BACL
MVHDEQRAKDLFTAYLGSSLEMHRQGRHEEYKAFQIPIETEIEWFNELIDRYSKELSIMDWNAVSRLEAIAKNHLEPRIIENVTLFAGRHVMSADSAVKLMYAEHLIRLTKVFKKVISKELLYNAYRTAVQILEDIISKPLIIDPGHELQQFKLKDKKSLNNRARMSVEEIKEELNL